MTTPRPARSPAPSDADALVVGAGPNGLVAANLLADAGWQVLVLEEQDEPGGGVRSGRYVEPGFVSDLCSAFYPLAAASPVMRDLRLEEHGLVWRHAPAVLAHPFPDGRCAVLSRDLDRTADSVERLAAGDGQRWRELHQLWRRLDPHLMRAVTTPFPPVRAGVRLAARLGPRDLLPFTRFALLPVRRLAEEWFRGEGAMLLAGNALHADFSPESPTSGTFGWLLAMLGQDHGFPVPEGGAGQLTAALVRRLESRGGQVRCGQRVTQVLVRSGRAVGVRTADGRTLTAGRAVLADVVAPDLYGGLVGWEHLPSRLRRAMGHFQWDWSTVKVDWALDGPVPWTAEAAGSAGTVHLAPDMGDLSVFAEQVSRQVVPARPFLLLGQMTTADPSRSPAGTQSLWAYTHVPQEVRGDAGPDGLTGRWDERETEAIARRIEERIEAFAPGFRSRIRARVVATPDRMRAHNRNLHGGAINGGTMNLHQQLVFRPVPGLGRPTTPVRGLYLASASAHPGGGVHGACGANAARAALHEAGLLPRLAAVLHS